MTPHSIISSGEKQEGMKFSETYIGRLREKIGNDLLQVPGGRIILEDKEGRVLLQKRSDFGVWGLPAGSPEVGDSASESIKREVLEETGLVVSGLKCFGYSSNPEYETIQYPNGHLIHCYCLLYYATDWDGELIESNSESVALGFFATDELPEMLRNMRRTVEMYQRYKETGEFQLD